MKYLFKVYYTYDAGEWRRPFTFTLIYRRRFSLNTLIHKFYTFCDQSGHKDVRIEELTAQYIRENKNKNG